MTDNEQPFDPFAGESGLKDDYDGVIEDAWFGTNDKYGDTVLLHLALRADDGDEVENRYPCGPDWATYDGGATVEHPKGGAKMFNVNTRVMSLIKAMMATEAESVLRERSKAGPVQNDERKGDLPAGPKAASLYKGLRFHWNAHKEMKGYKDKETGEWKDQEVTIVLPTAFLGVEDGSDAAGGATGSTSTAASPSASTPAPAAATPPPSNSNPVLIAALKQVAKTAPDYNAFVDGAMEVEGVMADNDLMGKVADEAFYQSLRAG